LKDELKLVDRATRVEALARIAERIAPPPPPRAAPVPRLEARALAATEHGIGSHTITHPISPARTPLNPSPTRGTQNPPPRSGIQATGTPHPHQRTPIKIQNG
jgi:hypothetical protein